MIRDDLIAAIGDALADAGLPDPPDGIELTPPKQREHGDWATNVAMQLAKAAGRNPREIAEEIARRLEAAEVPHLDGVEVAGPGFLNFRLEPGWLHDVLRDVIDAGEEYGTSDALSSERINLEFVSLNPTGPVHAGGARWAAVGDALANLLSAQGADVHREYYVNDAGNQLDAFGASLLARLQGEETPDDGYQGAYVTEIADEMRSELGDSPSSEEAREWGYRRVVAEQRSDLERIGVTFDTWFSERSLHEGGAVEATVDRLRERGAVEEREGAVWFTATEWDDDRDRVLVKSDGAFTYLAADIAYHCDKLDRGWGHLVDIWGADHHGQVKSLQAALAALGVPAHSEFGPEPEIILGQLVTLQRDGRPVRLSKRTGDMVTLAEVLDEVDPDATRLTFLLQGIDNAQTFDVDVVTSQSMENPVYYVQYAHARIASIGRIAEERDVVRKPLGEVDLDVLDHERELELLRCLAEYPDVVADAASVRAPHRLTTWVRDLGGRFHGFYHDCRVLPGETTELPDVVTQARLWLVEACRIGLANALAVLGVSAPERMERLDDEDGSTEP